MTEIPARLFADVMLSRPARNLYTGEGAQLYAAFVAKDNTEFGEVATAVSYMQTSYIQEHEPQIEMASQTPSDVAPIERLGLVVGDLACGDGRLMLSIDSNKVEQYFALDMSPVLLSQVFTRAESLGIERNRISTVCADMLNWDPDPDFLDLAILGAGTIRLFDVSKRQAIYAKVLRALGNRGIFYISTSEPVKHHNRIVCLGEVALNGRSTVAYFYDSQIEHENDLDAREIGFVVFETFPNTGYPRVYSSIVHNLSGEDLALELLSAGFEIVKVITKKTEGINGVDEKMTSIIAKVGE